MPNRKQFIESHGATCQNWNWSWSFINATDKIVIFGAWDMHTDGGDALILSEEWKKSYSGRNQPGYKQAREHVRLIEEEGYSLKTFPILFSNEKQDNNGYGPAKIKGFIPKLTPRKLKRVDSKWYASDDIQSKLLPEEIADPQHLFEGASQSITVNKYERNPTARAECIAHYGYKCAVCSFDFEEHYGAIGAKYIHVHHLVPLATIKQEYALDPIKDLRPVCPNCHAIIHKTQPILEIEQLQQHLKGRN